MTTLSSESVRSLSDGVPLSPCTGPDDGDGHPCGAMFAAAPRRDTDEGLSAVRTENQWLATDHGRRRGCCGLP